MATQTKQIKLDEKHDLDLYHQEAINIAKIAGKVGGLCELFRFRIFLILCFNMHPRAGKIFFSKISVGENTNVKSIM